jgi:hypothetical protein
MTPDEIKALVAAEIASALAANKPEMETEVEMAAAAEAEAGVTDADKKESDGEMPAAVCAAIRIHRATVRLTNAALAASKDETVKLAEAKFTQAIGSGKFNITSGKEDANEYTAKLAEYRKTAPSDQMAAFRLLKDHPELLPQHEEATRARIAKLTPKL